VSATTVDVLAVYGRQFSVVVPVQIGFSRGADGVVVRRRSNASMICVEKRWLPASSPRPISFSVFCATAGLKVKSLDTLDSERDPDAVNLLFTSDGFTAATRF